MTHVLDLASPRHKANPAPTYARLRAEAPVVQITASDKKPAWLITRHADVASALKDPRLAKNAFRALSPDEQKAQRPWMPAFVRPLATTMLDQDPPDHSRLRGLVHQAFTPRRVEDLRARIETLTGDLIAQARARGSFDLLEAVAAPLPMTIISDMLSIPKEDRARFAAMSNRVVTVTSPADMVLAIPTVWMLMRYMRKLIAKRRRSGGDDLMTALIQAEEEGSRLSEDELLSMVLLLLIAGHETTVNLIASGTLALLDDPESLDRLRREPELIKPAVEELLRFTNPVEIATDRFSTEEVAFGDRVIPRGQRVFAVLFSANYDDEVFERPERLKLDREPNRHVAFGGGPHYCLGAPLARLEAQVALAAIVRDLPGLRLAVPRASVRWKRSLQLRGLDRLPLQCAPAPVRSISDRRGASGADAHV